MSRAPYSHAQLRALMDPASIAVVGASPRAGSFGGRTFANLAGFDGRVYPVNAKYDEIDGQRCYPTLDALPEVPDLVVLTTPAPSVPELFEACVDRGVPSVMVYASGFAEIGDPGARAAQEHLALRAAQSGVRLLGPNCVGLLNYATGARVSFATVPEGRLTPGPAIGLVCQSGALGFALAQAKERGVSFSHVLTCGNSADVDVADWVSALAEDAACHAIACVFEGLADPQKLLVALKKARAAGKPVIMHKIATGEEGAIAAMSHTASLAGPAAWWQALFDHAGAITVTDFEAVLETASFFAKVPKGDKGHAPGVAVLSGSGGAAIMAADWAEATGVPMPQPRADIEQRLRDLIPPFVPPRNPCDVTAGVINDQRTLLACGDALLSDPQYGALIYAYSYAYDTATHRQPHLSALSAEHGKPVICVWLTQLIEGPGRAEAERDPHLIVMSSMRRAMEILRAWNGWAWSSWGRGAVAERVEARSPPQAARDLIAASAGTSLTEAATRDLLRAYGVTVPEAELAQTPEAAGALAERIGGPVALKIDSPDIAHKTDIGGVVLNVTGAGPAQAAYDRIMAAAAEHCPEARINGVLVQQMVPLGVEVLCGLRNAPGFGPMVTVGLGGVLTELLGDAMTALAPVSEVTAQRMLDQLRGAAILQGVRGAAAVDIDGLSRTIAAMSRLIADFPDDIAELEVNPLICLPDRCIAVDGWARLI